MSTATWWVRHGQSTWNAAGRLQGREASPPLTELGIAQAHAAAERLAETGATRLLTSPAVRAAQTAEVVAEALGLAVEPVDLLVEKGLDESTSSLRARVAELLRNVHEPTILLTHGDVIVVAAALLTGATIDVPDNGSVQCWRHRRALLA